MQVGIVCVDRVSQQTAGNERAANKQPPHSPHDARNASPRVLEAPSDAVAPPDLVFRAMLSRYQADEADADDVRAPIASRSTVSSSSIRASNSATVASVPGQRKSAAISAAGAITKRRSVARGCGRTNCGVVRGFVAVDEQIEIEFARRVADRRRRPAELALEFASAPASKASGVSPLRGSNATTAFTKSPESGGQSTGLVRHSDELRNAPRRETAQPFDALEHDADRIAAVRADADQDQHRKATGSAMRRTSVRRTPFGALLK